MSIPDKENRKGIQFSELTGVWVVFVFRILRRDTVSNG